MIFLFDLSVKEWLFSLVDCGYILPGPLDTASLSLSVGHTAPAQLHQVHRLSPKLRASQPGLQPPWGSSTCPPTHRSVPAACGRPVPWGCGPPAEDVGDRGRGLQADQHGAPVCHRVPRRQRRGKDPLGDREAVSVSGGRPSALTPPPPPTVQWLRLITAQSSVVGG